MDETQTVPTAPTTEAPAAPAQTSTPEPQASLVGDPAPEAAPPAAAPGAPAPLTAEAITLPEGFSIDQPVMDEFLGVLNDTSLKPQELAQKLVDLQIKSLEGARESGSKAWDDMMGQWQNEVRNDPTVGGARFDQSIAAANQVVKQFGSPELAQLCATTGIGNNVHFVKFLNSIAPKLLEPAPVLPGAPPAAGGSTPDAVARRLYDNPTSKVK